MVVLQLRRLNASAVGDNGRYDNERRVLFVRVSITDGNATSVPLLPAHDAGANAKSHPRSLAIIGVGPRRVSPGANMASSSAIGTPGDLPTGRRAFRISN